jgi:hypothetical protein
MNPDHVVGEHIQRILPLLSQVLSGDKLPFPWLRATHGVHYGSVLYCWDHHHMGMRFADVGMPQYMRHYPENLLLHQTSDGFVPNMVHCREGPLGGPRVRIMERSCGSHESPGGRRILDDERAF